MKNPSDHPILDILANRWSPYGFDAGREISSEDLTSLFEAARWTMSAKNTQPWRYIVGVKSSGDGIWEQLLDSFLPHNQTWAKCAPVLVVTVMNPDMDDGSLNKCALYDLGAASANLTNEATARGIQVHQIAGIQPDKIKAAFDLSKGLQPMTGLVIGYAAPEDQLDPTLAERQSKPRVRKSLDELVIAGKL